jgi:hypothetical protein
VWGSRVPKFMQHMYKVHNIIKPWNLLPAPTEIPNGRINVNYEMEGF